MSTESLIVASELAKQVKTYALDLIQSRLKTKTLIGHRGTPSNYRCMIPSFVIAVLLLWLFVYMASTEDYAVRMLSCLGAALVGVFFGAAFFFDRYCFLTTSPVIYSVSQYAEGSSEVLQKLTSEQTIERDFATWLLLHMQEFVSERAQAIRDACVVEEVVDFPVPLRVPLLSTYEELRPYIESGDTTIMMGDSESE